MKKVWALPSLALSLVLAFGLVGCGGSSTPVEAVKAFYKALGENDLDGVRSASCRELADKYVIHVKGAKDRGLRMSLEDGEFTLESQDDDRAVVRVKGREVLTQIETGRNQSKTNISTVRVVKEDGEWKFCER